MASQQQYQSYTDALRDLAATPIETAQGLAQRTGAAAMRQFCRGMATASRYAGADSATQRFTDNVCGPYYDEPGNSPGGPGEPPYEGGQCPGVAYTISWRVEYEQGGPGGPVASFPDAVILTGPITNVFIRPRASSPGTSETVVEHAGGERLGNAQFTNWNPRLIELSVTRNDGQPDNCGSPDAPLLSPTVSDPYNFGDSEDVDGVGPIATGAPRGIPGLPTIPIDAPEIPPVDGFIPDPLPDDFRPEERGAQPGPSPATPDPNDPQNHPFGEPPDGFVWVGACVELFGYSATDSSIFGTGPDFITPQVLGNVRLLIRFEGGLIKLDPPRRVNSLTYLAFRAVAGVEVLGARVNAPPNLTLTVTPLMARDEREDPLLV